MRLNVVLRKEWVLGLHRHLDLAAGRLSASAHLVTVFFTLTDLEVEDHENCLLGGGV